MPVASGHRWRGKEGSDRRGDAIEGSNKEVGNMAAGDGRRGSRSRGKLSPRVLADIVRRIVEVARPQQIVLFGSAARGAMGPNSDVDLLVVKSGRFHRGRLVEAIYRNLRGAAAPVDVLVVTPEELERYRSDPCLIVAPAVREGRLVYGSQTPAPK
jgi:uncharacterized protein